MLPRAARPTDYATFARLFPELRVPDEVPDEAKFAGEMAPTTLVLERSGAAVGLAYYQILERTGFLRILITDPAARRRGVGRALMEATRAQMLEAGCAEMCLNVLPDNAPAIALYESFGLRRAHLSRSLRFPWALLDRAPAPRADGASAARAIQPEDDARVERDTGMMPGVLADARTKEGRVLSLIERSGKVVAAAVFDTTFPGAYPFRATMMGDALDLLRALRPAARAHDAAILLMVEEGDVARALVALGATVRLEALHMRGALLR